MSGEMRPLRVILTLLLVAGSLVISAISVRKADRAVSRLEHALKVKTISTRNSCLEANERHDGGIAEARKAAVAQRRDRELIINRLAPGYDCNRYVFDRDHGLPVRDAVRH